MVIDDRRDPIGFIEVIELAPVLHGDFPDVGAMPFARGVIEQGQLALGVAGDHRFGQRLEQSAIHFLMLVELSLLLFALADVGNDPVPDRQGVVLALWPRGGTDPDHALERVHHAKLVLPA